MLPPPPLISPEETISGDHHSPSSYSVSILIIFSLLIFAVLVIVSIHFLLRFLSKSSSSSSSSTMTSSPDPVTSLPIITFSSSSMRSPSRECAVCLSPFEPRDRLRLLPTCRHAFHSRCIDTWLRSTLSCPLCRAPATAPPPQEIPSVSSQEHFVEHVAEEEEEEKQGPGDDVAEVAGDGGNRSWLREYVDRLTSSASSSLRWSRRMESGSGNVSGRGGGGGGNWDLERNLHLHLEEEDGGFSSFYRWLLGV